MLSIGTKKYRNLQEQVGYNTECIKKLDEYLDGITLQDKLVIIANDSGTFTEKELETLSMPLAFIANASKVWMKENETVSELVYKAIDVVATEIGSAYFKIGGSKIVIDKATRAFAISDNDIILTYSKDQIDVLLASKADASALTAGLALKANVAGQAFTGAITAPSIIETMSGYSFLEGTPSNITLGTIYAGACKNGNKLTLVWASNIKRTSAIGSFKQLASFTLPNDILGKLHPVTIGGVSVLDVKTISAVNDMDGSPVSTELYFAKTSSTVEIRARASALNALTQDVAYYIRYEATFLLSDNLAS